MRTKSSLKSIITKTFFTSVLFLSFLMISCSKKEDKSAKAGKRTIVVALSQSYVPYAYVDENDKPKGYEYDFFKEVEKLLPQYNFEYKSTTLEDGLLGLDTGRNQVLLNGLFKNPAREKKYAIPKNPESVTVTGFVVSKKFESKLKGFYKENGYTDIIDNKLRLGPVNSNTGHYGVVQEYNENYPDKPLDFETNATRFGDAEQLNWILQGRYDALIFNEHQFTVLADVNQKYYDNIIFVPTYSIGVYPIFGKNETQLLADYEKAFETLWNNGTLDRLQKEYFKKDVFSLLRDKEKVSFN